jgi:hypothetical protein
MGGEKSSYTIFERQALKGDGIGEKAAMAFAVLGHRLAFFSSSHLRR